LIAVGDVFLDVLVPGGVPGAGEQAHAAVEVRAGGSAVTAALVAAARGAESTVVGRVGDDVAGRAVAGALESVGVRPRLAVDPERPTGALVAAGRGSERGVVAAPGANAAFAPGDVPATLVADAVLVSGYTLLQAQSAAAGRAALERAAAAWVAVDVAAAGLVRALGATAVLDAASGTNVLLANEDEARELTSGAEAERAVRVLARAFDVACVKRGSRGAVACSRGTVAVAEATEIDGNALGAGDVFDAAFLLALAGGSALDSALQAANDAAADHVAAGQAAASSVDLTARNFPFGSRAISST